MGEGTGGGEAALAKGQKTTFSSHEVGESQSLPWLTAQGAAATIKEEKRQEGKGQIER